MSFRFSFCATAALAGFATVGLAQEVPEGRMLAELAFESVDVHGNGFIHQGDVEQFRGLLFTSMDSDESGRLTLDEWMGWDYGFRALAEETGKLDAYETALKVVFAVADANANGEVSQTEHRKFSLAGFLRADLNNDAILSEEEYLNGFTVLVALRAALKPEAEGN